MTPYDSSSFTAGKDAGTLISACVARLAALQLVEDSRWWNRWRHRLMARALVACAEEMESAADAKSPEDAVEAKAPGEVEQGPRMPRGRGATTSAEARAAV